MSEKCVQRQRSIWLCIIIVILTQFLMEVGGGRSWYDREGQAILAARHGRNKINARRQGRLLQADAPRQNTSTSSKTPNFKREKRKQNAEFIAGSFIITQKALDEAPFRYSSFLTQALEVMKMKDPPTKSDEENCNVRYRIEPSGRRNTINVIENSLHVELLENNTMTISAALDVKVPARTWIWKGINFGFLGCMKISSCGGQIVTYGAHIDMQVALKILWDEKLEKVSVVIKPVETQLSAVNVVGCRPPWYLWWFKSWQEMLNNGVQQAFQDFADTYSHSLNVPSEMTIHKNMFITYKITNLIWSPDFVAFEAKATFKAQIGKKNITFIPDHEDPSLSRGASTIPIGRWPQSSASDHQSHLLQGVRLSGYFLNSIMWYASITNVTEYHSNTTVLDSQINGTISYTPPILEVKKDGTLHIMIPTGKLLAVCQPVKEVNATTAVLFKAEFTDLAGSGTVRLAAGKKPGIIIEIRNLDLSNLKTKPFEPKLPLPETFESDLMKSGIAQLRPIINQYLVDKPIFLPERIAPLVAYPEVYLNRTNSGLGYAQILSYCTCSDFQAPGAFSKCDERSGLCEPKVYNRRRRQTATDRHRRKRKPVDISKVEFEADKLTFANVTGADFPVEELPKIANILNKSTTFHKVIDVANNFIENHFLTNLTNEEEIHPERDMIISRGLTPNLLELDPIYLIQFETSDNCSMSGIGDNAKTYRLIPKSECTPIVVGNKNNPTNQYYVFKPDGSRVLFGCFDAACKTCSFNVNIRQKDVCVPQAENSQSFIASTDPARIQKSFSKNNGTKSISIFFNINDPCEFDESASETSFIETKYEKAAMLATSFQLGLDDFGCIEMQSGGYLSVESITDRNTNITRSRVKIECNDICQYCGFDIPSLGVDECQTLRRTSRVLLSQAQVDLPEVVIAQEPQENVMTVVLVVSLSLTLVFSTLSIVATIWCCKTGKSGEMRINKYRARISNKFSECGTKFYSSVLAKHLGIRFMNWKDEDVKNILEDSVQNILLCINGVCAILFAFEWNSPNNPLYLFTTKVSTQVDGVGNSVIEMTRLLIFASNLNYWTYICNIVNGVIAFIIILSWCITRTGARESWTKARLFSSTMMLTSILLTIACLIFTTYFDDLVTLNENSGFFITDNVKMRKITEVIVQVSLNGLSLTVISFTIVFLFHGVGGGLFSGSVLFRILHMYSKEENLEILTTLLVILTIIQPFICLHPVIIWSQDSSHNAKYLILTIFVWFLPLGVHLLTKAILTQINTRYINRGVLEPTTSKSELTPLNNSRNRPQKRPLAESRSVPAIRHETTSQSTTQRNLSKRVITAVDMGMQITQLFIFLSAFSFITHHIINTELDSKKSNLKHFVLPAIISVFFWMTSISYYLLDLTMNATKDPAPLMFKDKTLTRARQELHESLRKRLTNMDKRKTVAGGPTNSRQASIRRPKVPPPPPPGLEKGDFERNQFKSRSLPPVKIKSKTGRQGQDVVAVDSGRARQIQVKVAENESDIDSPVSSSTSKDNLEKTTTSIGSIEALEIQEDNYERTQNRAWYSFLLNYLLERQEYAFPETHGWRIKFRRIFLHLGVLGFSYTTFETLVSTDSYSSKDEIQKVLDYVGTNLTWPDQGSALDDVFELYNQTQKRKSYVMIAASILFWSSIAFDNLSFWTSSRKLRSVSVVLGRVVNFLGSLLVFASVILVGLPDYLEASHLDEICPYCGAEFNRTVKYVAEFSIGLFFASLFTFQLLPVLMTIAPALVRASVLILIHPGLRGGDKTSALRMSILQKVIVVSSLLSFPITFVSMCIVNQHQKDVVVTILIILYWTLPPLTLYLGLHYARTFQKYSILLFVYYLYNCVYVGLVLALALYSLQLEQFIQMLRDMLQSPSVWFGTTAQVFLCNVVISDLLYMTVF